METAHRYAQMSDDDLITEFGMESWAADRCASTKESQESEEALQALRQELLKRMAPPPQNPIALGGG